MSSGSHRLGQRGEPICSLSCSDGGNLLSSFDIRRLKKKWQCRPTGKVDKPAATGQGSNCRVLRQEQIKQEGARGGRGNRLDWGSRQQVNGECAIQTLSNIQWHCIHVRGQATGCHPILILILIFKGAINLKVLLGGGNAAKETRRTLGKNSMYHQ